MYMYIGESELNCIFCVHITSHVNHDPCTGKPQLVASPTQPSAAASLPPATAADEYSIQCPLGKLDCALHYYVCSLHFVYM